MTCYFCQSDIKEKKIVKTKNWKIVACPKCKNAWTVPFPDSINYRDEDFHGLLTLDNLPTQWRKCLEEQKKLIERYLKKGKRILEIGCGHGFLLKLLEDDGYIVTGIEPSLSAVESAKKNNLDVRCGKFPEAISPNDKFDLVIMSQVLEHIENPLSIIKEIKKHTGEKGKLLLVQTNYLGLVPRLEGSRWYAWVPEQHYWHFNPRGLSIFLEKQGYKNLEIKYSSIIHRIQLSPIEFFWPKLGDQFYLLLEIC